MAKYDGTGLGKLPPKVEGNKACDNKSPNKVSEGKDGPMKQASRTKAI